MSRRVLFSILALTGLTALIGTGCAHQDPADSNIPWNRPATWEDQIPGMGNF